MSKSMSVVWSQGVSDQESQLLTATVGQVLMRLFMSYSDALTAPPIPVRVFGNWFIPALVPDKPYWGLHWYVMSSYDSDLKQVIGPTYMELVRREPWQRAAPHFDLALLDFDLTDFAAPLARLRPDHYSLGTSLPGTVAVMSVFRLRELSDEQTREMALARLVRHHLGHVLGIPGFTRQEQVARLGLELHCTNLCVMRHAATVQQLAERALQESEMGWPYCEQCTRELHSVVVRYRGNWN